MVKKPKTYSVSEEDESYIFKQAQKLSREKGKNVSDSHALAVIIAEHRQMKKGKRRTKPLDS